MSSDQHENKPAVAGGQAPAPVTPRAEHLNIRVTDTNNNEIVFKIKKSTSLEKLMGAYCNRYGKTPNSVRFFYEGERLKGSETPSSLELADGDTIEVYYEQQGGNGGWSCFSERSKQSANP